MVLIGMTVVLQSGCSSPSDSSIMARDLFQIVTTKAVQVAKLSPGDTFELSVEVDGSMEIAMHRAIINAQGVATLPLIGDVRIGGLTLDEARSLIAKAYGVYYVNPPVIMINLATGQGDSEWGFVTVTGRVEQPGRVQIQSPKGMKLTEVIQRAGGFATSAKKNEILISRTNKDGTKIQISVDYNEIGQQGNMEADIDLLNGDIVYVPERIF